MTAFDTDILSDLARSVPAVVTRARGVPVAEQAVPIVAAEEALRGQLATIRRAQAGGGPVALERAYAFFGRTLAILSGLRSLPYTAVAHALFQAWRTAKIRVGTQDLRIAAICVAHQVKLATRNARDFGQVPGLNLEVWN